jgi:hypothetical protein
MPPKIRGMSANFTLKRFTLMLPGEDCLDDDTQESLGGAPAIGLPHERFLLGAKLPIAPVLLLGQSDQAFDPSLLVACLQPVHFHATRDHLVLLGQNQINLTSAESAQLLQEALPFIEEDFQAPLLFNSGHYWFIQAGPFASLATHSVDQAHGRNIDWWMPRDHDQEGVAKRWRKLQNEIQMLWHVGSTNEERAARGLPSINSLWISGIGKLQDVQTPRLFQEVKTLYGPHSLLAGLAKYLGIAHQEQLDASQLTNAFAWLDHAENIWPILSKALIQKDLDEIELIDFPKGKVRQRILKIGDLYRRSWKVWKKPEMRSWKEVVH